MLPFLILGQPPQGLALSVQWHGHGPQPRSHPLQRWRYIVVYSIAEAVVAYGSPSSLTIVDTRWRNQCCLYSWCATILCSSCTAAPTTCCPWSPLLVNGNAINLLPIFYIVLGCWARLLLSMVSVMCTVTPSPGSSCPWSPWYNRAGLLLFMVSAAYSRAGLLLFVVSPQDWQPMLPVDCCKSVGSYET